MTLASGTRLGPYEILSPLGAGGMGEVYRARDTRLGREVAVKILPEDLANDAERISRFEREARSASALSHAHVVSVFDVGREKDRFYIVTEVVAGGSLRDLLDRGPLPFRRALDLAVQIASGLAEAHESGIVHRDLKPENILLTKSGDAKIADFGLAKLVETEGADLSQLPTSDGLKTSDGLVMGTVAYMSPEQASGRAVDFRSDQFAFGSILYEMLAGKPPFRRASPGETMAAVIRDEPDPPGAGVPPQLFWVVERCLSKEPADRYGSTRDLARELALLRQHLSEVMSGPAAAPAPSPIIGRRRDVIPWAIAGVLLLGVVVLVARRGSHSPPDAGPIRFSVPPPANGAFSFFVEDSFLAVSPDGSRLAYVASDPEGGQRIFLRRLSDANARPIPGTEAADSLFFSPDGRSIAFFAEAKLKRVELSGGAAVPICDLPLIGRYWSGTWGSDGDILFAGVTRGRGIFHVSASGGAPANLIPVDLSRGEARIGWPWFLPDGRRFLYLLRYADGHGSLMLAEPGKKPRPVMPMLSAVQYVDPGYLIFVKDGALLGQRFDSESGRVTGEPFSIAEQVRYFLTTGGAAFAVSRTGTLAYQSQGDVSQLAWFDRTGRELGSVGPHGRYVTVSISSDGRRALFDRARPGVGTWDVWSLDLERGTETPVVAAPETDVFPIWLPDGKSIAFSADRGEAATLFRKDLATGREEKLVANAPSEEFQIAQDVSPDGRSLVYMEATQHGWFDLWTYPLDGGGRPVPLLRAPFPKSEARFSPDGRYVAMITAESGRPDVYVTPYPGPGERIRVSTGGARALRWSRDGELLFVSGDDRLMSIPIRTAPSLQIGTPTELFALKGKWPWLDFDVSKDGKRFLAIVPEVVADELPLNVVVNWKPGVAE
ncbi:MAG TPA: protein kinase [Thermoanaerobaculia bacterium]|nr:protein kinase [Thermoanaerobaculia bacterium]